MKAVLNIHTGVIVVGIAVCLWTSIWAAAGWALCALIWYVAAHLVATPQCRREGMSDLITRLEEAAEGSRELDELVALGTTHPYGIGPSGRAALLPYTTSIDQALALAERVLPGSMWGFQQNTTDPAHPDVLPFSAWTGRIEAMGRSFPLAICAAILRANHKDKP